MQAALALTDDELEAAEAAAVEIATDVMARERVTSETIGLVQTRAVERVGSVDLPAGARLVVSGVVRSVIQPNLVLDTARVEEARAAAREPWSRYTSSKGKSSCAGAT